MFPVTLAVAIGVQLLCQLFKLILYSARDGRLELRYFVSAGGMPSAHSAFVTALLVAVGTRNGFASDLFAVAAVFGVIVMYDAFRLRGEVQKHAVRLNRIAREKQSAIGDSPGKHPAEARSTFASEGGRAEPESEPEPDKEPELTEMVGHSVGEIVAGMLVGGALSAAATLLLPA